MKLKIIIFILLFIVLDRSIGFICSKMFFKTETGLSGGIINGKLKKADNNILIFGDSKALHHYDPNVITSLTGLSCANLGIAGMGIDFTRLLITLLLDNEHQDFKIAVIEAHGLAAKERLLAFAPFYNHSNEVKQQLDKYSLYNSVLMQSQTFRYNAKLLPIARSILTNNEISSEDIPAQLQGFYDTLTRSSTKTSSGKESPLWNDEVCKLYKTIISKLKDKHITVIITYSPQYGINYDAEKKIIEALRELAEETNVYFECYSANRYHTFTQVDLFQDQIHLNYRGAALLSKLLAEKITGILAVDSNITTN